MIEIEFPSSKGPRLLLGVVLLLLVPFILASPAWPASGVGLPEGAKTVIGTPPEVTKGPVDVDAYVNKGYSAVGPITVVKTLPNSLVLYRYPKDMVLDLKGKRTGFIKASGGKTTMAAITKGSRVYVFQKDNEAIVCLLEKREGGTNE